MEIPVYLFTGLLESGKTTLIQEIVNEEEFLDPGKTLLIQCEEGEMEFSREFLIEHEIELVSVEEEDALTPDFWKGLEQNHHPAQIMVEYNGMWNPETMFDLPEDWYIGGIYSTVNAETAELYLANMRKTFMDPLRYSNLIIFNRCDDDTDRLKFRRNLKALNPPVQVAFERKDGTMFQNETEQMPFDYSGEVIELDDMDYGLWYLDAMDHPDRYMDKEIRFTARFCASAKPGERYFVPGRHVMTCCEDDIQFLGFVCYFDEPPKFKHEDWVKVAVRYYYGTCDLYDEDGPILHLLSIEAGMQPEQELVTFS